MRRSKPDYRRIRKLELAVGMREPDMGDVELPVDVLARLARHGLLRSACADALRERYAETGSLQT